MKDLFTQEQREILKRNGADRNVDKDHVPVVKLFTPNASCTWLLTELDEEDDTLAFGLCDLGMGFPELGYVSLEEITCLKEQFIFVERDLHFKGHYPISVYARAASDQDEIVEDRETLSRYVRPARTGLPQVD